MTDQLYDKLSFNGFHVTYWNHETRVIEERKYPSYEDVLARGFAKDSEPFPDAKTFAEDLFNVYGDVVGKVVDNAGYVLYDNMKEMFDIEREMSTY